MKVYVLDCKTESSDEFFYIFKNYPTDYEIQTTLRRDHPDEFLDEEDDCLINWKIVEEEVIDN